MFVPTDRRRRAESREQKHPTGRCGRAISPQDIENEIAIARCRRRILAGVIREIASGSDEHIVHFARNFRLSFSNLPIHPEPAARLSVAAWVRATGVTNVHAPIAVDASKSVWPIASAEGIICINMVHISPWEATLGLIKGAAVILPPGSPLYLYGPYKRERFATAPRSQ
jgi:Protein of unknown function (DUF938)